MERPQEQMEGCKRCSVTNAVSRERAQSVWGLAKIVLRAVSTNYQKGDGSEADKPLRSQLQLCGKEEKKGKGACTEDVTARTEDSKRQVRCYQQNLKTDVIGVRKRSQRQSPRVPAPRSGWIKIKHIYTIVALRSPSFPIYHLQIVQPSFKARGTNLSAQQLPRCPVLCFTPNAHKILFLLLLSVVGGYLHVCVTVGM